MIINPLFALVKIFFIATFWSFLGSSLNAKLEITKSYCSLNLSSREQYFGIKSTFECEINFSINKLTSFRSTNEYFLIFNNTFKITANLKERIQWAITSPIAVEKKTDVTIAQQKKELQENEKKWGNTMIHQTNKTGYPCNTK